MPNQEVLYDQLQRFFFHQYYKGLRVYGANYLVHENAEGNIYSVNGDIANNEPIIDNEEGILESLPGLSVISVILIISLLSLLGRRK